MKSITIHGLEDPLDTLIREKARQEGLSLNKTIKQLLAETLGIKSPDQTIRKNEFADLCGVWSKKDIEEFEKNNATLSTVDPEDWK